MQQLTFEQHLLLMEAANRFTNKVRDRVAAGETYLQDTLTTLHCRWHHPHRTGPTRNHSRAH